MDKSDGTADKLSTTKSKPTQDPAAPISKSNSFRERAAARPDLFVQTSAVDEDASAVRSPSSADPYNLTTSGYPKSRKGSVPDRSPLQTLELKLGDISKEEKRARAAEAEEDIVRKHSTTKRGNPGDWDMAPQNGTSVSRKPVKNAETLPERVQQQKVIEGKANGRAPGPNRSNRAASGPAKPRTFSGTAEEDAMSGMNQGSIFARPRIRSSGYNASRSADPAAAAVGAYSASRRPADAQHTPSSGSLASPPADQLDGQAWSRNRRRSSGTKTGNRDLSAVPAGQQQLQTDRMGGAGGGDGKKAADKHQQPDPLPPSHVRTDSPEGPAYTIPPQTAGGRQARKHVAFGLDDPNQLADQSHQGHSQHQHHFHNMFHHGEQQERRYTASPSRSDWKNAETATLTAQDLNLSSKAWWESGNANKRGPTSPPAANASPQSPAVGTYGPATTFSPSLNLRCGPLLRYTGIRQQHGSGQKFWRGSVMIVVEDASSSYSGSGPTLRLFKQPMSLLQSPVSQQHEDSQVERMSNDLTAGLPKTSRTGQTLYVKPIHQVQAEVDLSQVEDDSGLFEKTPSTTYQNSPFSRIAKDDGERSRQYRDVKGFRLHAERGLTFWRFNIEVELTEEQNRVAYRINNGPPIGFWVPSRDQTMNIMFHSCNGFSMSVNPNEFSGPDPLWRDVLSSHQIRPFHCMIGGGDQIYNDRAMRETEHFQHWLSLKNPAEKHSAEFSEQMQEELEVFYLNRYAMWFSQGLFGLANSQIPMVNMWDDHDIIDGFGSYPHHFMSTSVFTGVGAIAFKYYMLFQHQSVPDETVQSEPSWLLGAAPGPYINQLSRSLWMSLGNGVQFLGLDCRTERMRDDILSQETYDLVFDRCRQEIIKGETKHLIVLLGVPIAYPRLNFLENVLTSRVMDPIKMLGRTGMLGGFVNKFDGGVEILDDLDDHWTAKHHKHERNWFIQELQELAAEKSVRITILGGDVHLAAVGQFYSNPKLGIPKDQDHRYMPNVISSAIVNTPPPEMMADVLNKRNKVHHLDDETDEYMIPIFDHDVDGKKRNNKNLLPRRNWCSIRIFDAEGRGQAQPEVQEEPPKRRRSFSLTRSLSRNRTPSEDGEQRPGLLRRLSSRNKAPPSAYRKPIDPSMISNPYPIDQQNDTQVAGNASSQQSFDGNNTSRPGSADERGRPTMARSNSWQQRPNTLSRRQSKNDRSGRQGQIELSGGLEITLNCEIDQTDPAGFTEPYNIVVPALFYEGGIDRNTANMKGRLTGFIGSFRGKKDPQHAHDPELEGTPYEDRQGKGTPPPTTTVGQRSLGADGTMEPANGTHRGMGMVGGGAAAGALMGGGTMAGEQQSRIPSETSQQFEDAHQYQPSTHENPINAASRYFSGQSSSSHVRQPPTHENPINAASRDFSGQTSYSQVRQPPTHENPINAASRDFSGQSQTSQMRQPPTHENPINAVSRDSAGSRQPPARTQQNTSEPLPMGNPINEASKDASTSRGTTGQPSGSLSNPINMASQDLHDDQVARQRDQAPTSARPTSSGDDGLSQDHKGRSQPRMSMESATSQEDGMGRPQRQRRYSASGPPPPSNIDELPASVRRRYQLLNDPSANDHLAQSQNGRPGSQANTGQAYSHGNNKISSRTLSQPQGPQCQYDQYGDYPQQYPMHTQSQEEPSRTQSRRKRFSQLRDPNGSKRYSQYEPLEDDEQQSYDQRPVQQPQPMQHSSQRQAPTHQPAPPPTADSYFRRYASKPMEQPLLPVTQNQLRSSQHRTLQSLEGSDADQNGSRGLEGSGAQKPGQTQMHSHGHQPTSTSFVNSLPQIGGASPYANSNNAQEAPTGSHRHYANNNSTAQSSSQPRAYAANQTQPLNTSQKEPINFLPLSRGQSITKKLQRKRGNSSSRSSKRNSASGPLPSPLASHAPDTYLNGTNGISISQDGTGASYQDPRYRGMSGQQSNAPPGVGYHTTARPRSSGQGQPIILPSPELEREPKSMLPDRNSSQTPDYFSTDPSRIHRQVVRDSYGTTSTNETPGYVLNTYDGTRDSYITTSSSSEGQGRSRGRATVQKGPYVPPTQNAPGPIVPGLMVDTANVKPKTSAGGLYTTYDDSPAATPTFARPSQEIHRDTPSPAQSSARSRSQSQSDGDRSHSPTSWDDDADGDDKDRGRGRLYGERVEDLSDDGVESYDGEPRTATVQSYATGSRPGTAGKANGPYAGQQSSYNQAPYNQGPPSQNQGQRTSGAFGKKDIYKHLGVDGSEGQQYGQGQGQGQGYAPRYASGGDAGDTAAGGGGKKRARFSGMVRRLSGYKGY